MIGQLLTGRYLILEQLGAGGFSETYLARDKYLPHHPLCVAKCLKLSPNNPIPLATAQRLFKTEAQVLAELGQHCDQIPTLLAYSHDPQTMYQIQQYIEGKNLGQILQMGQRLNSAMAIALLLEVLPILQYVHAQGVIHRDIKPSNLIQAVTGKIMLIDFGAACRLETTATGTQLVGEDADLAIGTPGYMPPEQQTGNLQFSSDLYALAVSTIFLLTGVHPRTLAHNPISGELDWQMHLGQRSIHPGLAQVLGGMTRYHASDRYHTAHQVLEAMQPFVGGQSAAAPPPAQPITFQARQSHSRWLWWGWRSLVMLGVTLGIVGGGYVYAHKDSPNLLLARMGIGAARSTVRLTLAYTIPLPAPIQQVAFDGRDRYLLIATAQQVQVWSLAARQRVQTVPAGIGPGAVLSVSDDGEWLALGRRDRLVQVWHLPSGKKLRLLGQQQTPISAIAFSADAQTIACGSEDGTVRLWQRSSGIRQRTLARSGSAITTLSFGPTSDRLVSANRNSELQLWNLQTGQLQRTFAGHTAPILQLQILDPATLLSVGADRSLVWQLQQEELMRSSPKYRSPQVTAAIRDRQVMTVDDQGMIQTWQLDTGKTNLLLTNQPTAQTRLSAQGHYLATWNRDRHLTLWQFRDRATGAAP